MTAGHVVKECLPIFRLPKIRPSHILNHKVYTPSRIPAALAEYDAATWRLRSRPGPVLLVLMGHRRSTFCHFPRGRQQPRQQAQSNPNSKPPAVIAVSNVDLRSDAATQTRHFESQTSFEITGRWQRDFQCRQIQHFRRRAERSRCVKRGRREDGSPRPTGRD
jgi:hypothetical protein